MEKRKENGLVQASEAEVRQGAIACFIFGPLFVGLSIVAGIVAWEGGRIGVPEVIGLVGAMGMIGLVFVLEGVRLWRNRSQ